MAEGIFWADKLAKEVADREARLKRVKEYRTEMGLGASGLPHVGNLSDAIRSYAVTLGLKDLKLPAVLIAFSDDRDGLRKVPAGFSNSLEKELGKPVSEIPDPFGCHPSYGAHMTGLLMDAVEETGVKDYKFMSGAESYGKGLLNEQIEKILFNEGRIKEIIRQEVGQDIPTLWMPICEKCGRIYTTRVTKFLPDEKAVEYSCDKDFEAKNVNTGKKIIVKGCGFRGAQSYLNGHGKLAWKVEIGARWAALKVVFEAYGKELIDSMRINDIISREVLGWEPPVHAMYEHFTEKGGGKMSKSLGNVLTPQDWLRYGSPSSLRLLMLKRFTGARELGPEDIPTYMEEMDRLEKVYNGKEDVENEKELSHLKRLFEYAHFLDKPKPSLGVPYHTLVSLVRMLPVEPEKKLKIISDSLADMGAIPKQLDARQAEELAKRIGYATAWVESEGLEAKPAKVKTKKEEKAALQELLKLLKTKKTGGEIQAELFEIARRNEMKTGELFKLIYRIILGSERGPRAGPLMEAIGKEKVAKLIEQAL